MASELVTGMQAAIPFNNFVGIQYLDVQAGTSSVRLPDNAAMYNHIGSQHAAALFAAGEAASGGAFVGAFGDMMDSILPLAQGADISYKKVANGEIVASARMVETKDEILARLEADGRTRFPVEVTLTDAGGEVVAEMTVNWYMKKLG